MKLASLNSKATWRSKTFNYIFEFVVVFAGVFLAFWLTERRERQKEKIKEQEIYLAIYEDLTSFYKSGNVENPKGFVNFFYNLDHEVDSLVAEGQIPPRMHLRGDYWNLEIINTFVQGGILKDIDIDTYKKVSRFNTIHQNFLRTIDDFNSYYDFHITANYDKGIEYFYKPASQDLKPRFSYLNGVLKGIGDFAAMIVDVSDDLAGQIRDEHLTEVIPYKE